MTLKIPRPLILVADDEEDIRRALGLLLKGAGFTIVEAATPAEAIKRAESNQLSAALVDMNFQLDTTSGREGVDLVSRLANSYPDLPIVAMTAWASVQVAVDAMKAGAVDFIEKPWNNARVLAVIDGRIRLRQSMAENERLSQAQRLRLSEGNSFVVSRSEAMQSFLRNWSKVASSGANVLILGENGTGKSMLAAMMHQESPRCDAPFVKVDVGGLAPSLFESELFGHVKGAFTDAKSDRLGRFELADHGTLFLDEIANLGLDQQAKILRAIEDGSFERVGSSTTRQVDVRIISATNADLSERVRLREFREDLLYRLNPLQLRVPSLRERLADIHDLATNFLDAAALRYQRGKLELNEAACEALRRYGWPGNVRQLAHVMERAALLCAGQIVGPDDLQLDTHAIKTGSARRENDIRGLTLDEAEAELLRQALKDHRGNIQRAADQLGISRQSLYRKMNRHELAHVAT
ncbi:sigma-54-dependent transcriptional regulator [Xanthomonas arboricola]|uniref:sigma-54-dependent transcriptional regulator n=1 Tax=Xanthomonas arboricola TaxID=56448 RepID=UPI000C82009B|nr:sigma-54 dependent transcriptional regulator [Xanthomonas arboricola]PPU28739.1 sigma-54-dependent Fis family transcriptional regulator [Xanthomonas arboricola]PPU53431.1 sigma-54-dependent Fis family transcriptional regulator [Xanthomonas arboricola]SOT99535.1 two-component system regulatory protein [Xanthomonas arboricola pv. fragariae]